MAREGMTKMGQTSQKRQGEHAEQAALLRWTLEARAGLPELNLLFAIPNGARVARSVAARLKAEGLKSGVPDLFLPVARQGRHGLWIEMKAPGGRLAAEQRLWHQALSAQGYAVRVCRSREEAAAALRAYLEPLDIN